MTRLLLRNLRYFWRTNVAVVAGVATAVAVLAGALLVGESVRASLRDLLNERIGATDVVVSADRFFSQELSDRLAPAEPSGGRPATAPIIAVKGVLVREGSPRQAYDVGVYGVDDRFWRFHGLDVPPGFEDRAAVVGGPLASYLGVQAGDAVLLRIATEEDAPGESLFGRRENTSRAIRLTCRGVAGPERLGEFALRPGQGTVFSVFVPLQRLQRELAQPGRANTVLSAGSAESGEEGRLRRALRQAVTPADFGVQFRSLDGGGVAVESARILLDDAVAEAALGAASEAGQPASGVFAYVANAIRARGREIPYSVIAAADMGQGALQNVRLVAGSAMAPGATATPAIWLNEWAWKDLGVPIGESIEVDYYLWEESSGLATRSARFTLAGVVAIDGDVNASLTPEVPGVTGARTVRAWDPPFPLDLTKIREEDEDYWERYRGTPKAFVTLAAGQSLVAGALRPPDRGARRAVGIRDGRGAGAPDRPRGGRVHRGGRQAGRARRVPRSGGLGRVLPLFQFLPDRRGRPALGLVLQARCRAAGPRDRHAPGPRVPDLHPQAPVPRRRRSASHGGQPDRCSWRARVRRRPGRRSSHLVGWRGRDRPSHAARVVGRAGGWHRHRPRDVARRHRLDAARTRAQFAARPPRPVCWSPARPGRGVAACSRRWWSYRSRVRDWCWPPRPPASSPTSRDSSAPARCCSSPRCAWPRPRFAVRGLARFVATALARWSASRSVVPRTGQHAACFRSR